MNKKLENTKSANKAVDAVLNENAGTVAGVPALNEAVVLFRSDFAACEDTEEGFNRAMDGKTAAKHDTEGALIMALHPIARALRSFSKKAKNPELFAVVDVEEYELEKMRDTELLDFAKSVSKKAVENAAGLVAYNVTPQELTGLRAKIDAYEKALKAQGGGMASKSSEYDSLKVALRKVEDDLRDIDDIMERVRDKQPKFYDAYFAARRVKALGTRHNKAPETSSQNLPSQG